MKGVEKEAKLAYHEKILGSNDLTAWQESTQHDIIDSDVDNQKKYNQLTRIGFFAMMTMCLACLSPSSQITLAYALGSQQ